MRFSVAAFALFSSVVSVLGADHLVLVGDNATLTFNPSSVQAAAGDTVTFEFRSKNHSVTQSTFANPCALMTTPTTGVDSGFQMTANGTTTFAQWKITVDNGTAPLWFFCAQSNPKNHCQAGMVFAINPTADKTFAQYQQNAMNSGSSTGSTGSSSSVAGSTTAAASTGTASSVAGTAMATSLGTIATNAVPTAATGVSGAAATNVASSSDTGTTGNGALRMGTSAGGMVVAALIASFML